MRFRGFSATTWLARWGLAGVAVGIEVLDLCLPDPGGGYLIATLSLPAVLVGHENRGLNPYIEDVARRFAAEGDHATTMRTCRAGDRTVTSASPVPSEVIVFSTS